LSRAGPPRRSSRLRSGRRAPPPMFPPRAPRDTSALRTPAALPRQNARNRPPAAASPAPAPRTAAALPEAATPPAPQSSVGMTRYADLNKGFGIDYPTTWRVRPPATGAIGDTTFYLDHPDEGIALTVRSPSVVHGQANPSVVASILTQQLRKTYPDFEFTQVLTRASDNGRQESRVVAQWTNHWGQRMVGKGVIVTAVHDGRTTYVYAPGQAQEFVFPSLEPTIDRMLASFQPTR